MSIYFLFLESLGTPELALILVVALIVFGPRKLPTIGRTIGKYTAEFKRASRDFRETLEREVQEAELTEKGETAVAENSLAKFEADFMTNPNGAENTIGRGAPWAQNAETVNFNRAADENDGFELPQVRHVENADFERLQNGNAADEIIKEAETVKAVSQRKRDWL